VSLPIDVPVLVVGPGPGPVTVAKLLSGRGVPCLLAGHTVLGDAGVEVLAASAVNVLEANGLLEVLHPYVDRKGASVTIAPGVYEIVVKQHCVADINVIVYDEVAVVDRRAGPAGVEAIMTHGRSRWTVHASELVDGSDLPTSLPDAIVAAADLVDALLSSA
jgi:hypothetical protein